MKVIIGGIVLSFSNLVAAQEKTSSKHAVGHIDYSSFFLTFDAIILIIIILSYFLKRFTKLTSSSNHVIKMVSHLPLSTKEKIVLLDVGGQQLLVGVTAHHIQTLHQFSDKLDISPPDSNINFASYLNKAIPKNKEAD